jgi:hypothetical protein
MVFYDSKGVAIAKVQAIYQALSIELEGLLRELLFHKSILLVLLPQLINSIGSA